VGFAGIAGLAGTAGFGTGVCPNATLKLTMAAIPLLNPWVIALLPAARPSKSEYSCVCKPIAIHPPRPAKKLFY
jgi:hypothetical protein